jgi:hypothetical protein
MANWQFVHIKIAILLSNDLLFNFKHFMAKNRPEIFFDEATGMRSFPDIYTRRDQDAGWNVIQAATLLTEGRERKCASLVIYAALEFRIAIEQQIFTVIAVASGQEKLDEDMLEKCRKKDALFRILDEVLPKYSLRCRFYNALASFYPELPKIAEWDVRSMRRYYTDLSNLCHSQLVIQDMGEDPVPWDKKVSLLEEVYHFLESNMKKKTGVLKVKTEDLAIKDLWEKFSTGEINVEELTNRYAFVKPVFDSRRIIPP